MSGGEGFHFPEDPLADPVFALADAGPGQGPAAVCRDVVLPYLDAVAQVRLAASLRGAQVDDDEVLALLRRLGLDDRADHRPGQLSGGEAQRLAVACGVVGGPALVVADEPTAELDTAAAERVLAAMEELAASGVGFVVSSHDPRVMAIADGFVRLDHGRVVAA